MRKLRPHKKSHRQRRLQRLQLHPSRVQNSLLSQACLHHLRLQRPEEQRLRLSRRQLQVLNRISLPNTTTFLLSPVGQILESSVLGGSQKMPPVSQGQKLLNRARKGSYLSPRRLRKMETGRSF